MTGNARQGDFWRLPRACAPLMIGTAIALCGSLGSLPAVNAWASGGADGADPRLNKLEIKLFMHPYSREAEQTRLARLEKMVFGASMPGSSEKRLTRLMAAVSGVASGGSTGNPIDPSVAQAARTPPPYLVPSSGRPSPVAPALPVGALFSRVSSLELQVFGRMFTSELLADRLARLERGLMTGRQAHPPQTVAERVDRLLNQYARK